MGPSLSISVHCIFLVETLYKSTKLSKADGVDPLPHSARPEERFLGHAPKSGLGGIGWTSGVQRLQPVDGRKAVFGILEGENLSVHWTPGKPCTLLRELLGGGLGIGQASHVGGRVVRHVTEERKTHRFSWVPRSSVKKFRLCT